MHSKVWIAIAAEVRILERDERRRWGIQDWHLSSNSRMAFWMWWRTLTFKSSRRWTRWCLALPTLFAQSRSLRTQMMSRHWKCVRGLVWFFLCYWELFSNMFSNPWMMIKMRFENFKQRLNDEIQRLNYIWRKDQSWQQTVQFVVVTQLSVKHLAMKSSAIDYKMDLFAAEGNATIKIMGGTVYITQQCLDQKSFFCLETDWWEHRIQWKAPLISKWHQFARERVGSFICLELKWGSCSEVRVKLGKRWWAVCSA